MEEQALVQLANEVLSKLPGSLRVKSWKEINSRIFVSLYEGLFAEALPDVIRSAKSREDEVHNIQAVIDTLSLDILNTSLSHLSGEAIVSGNQQAVRSLLEVFEWLFEYILEKIGSEASSDIGGEVTLEDPDLVTPEVIDSILERELGRSHQSSITAKGRRGGKGTHRSKTEGNSTAELIALGNNSRSVSKMPSPDKTEDLIALGDSRQYRSRDGWTDGTATSPGRRPHQGERRGKNSRNTSQPLSTADLSSIVQESSIAGRDLIQDSRLIQAGVSSSRPAAKDVYISEKPVGSGVNARLSSPMTPISHGFNGDLSSGPLSSDVSDRGYVPDQSKDLSLSPALGKETTADLIRESERLEKQFGQTSGDNLSASQIHSRVSGLESSLASSSAYPKPVTTEPGTNSRDFDQIGLRPRSLITPPVSDSYRDNHANSLPLDPQYHSFTHHLYHHYTGDQTYPQSKSSVATSTQVTPGRFDIEENTAGSVRLGAVEGGKGPSGASQSCSYDNLRHLIQDTMNLSEQALLTSPLRSKSAGQPGTAVSEDDLTRRLRETLQKLHSSEDSATDRSGTLEKSRTSTLEGSRTNTSERSRTGTHRGSRTGTLGGSRTGTLEGSRTNSLERSRPDYKKQENLRPKTQSILSPSKGKKQPATSKVPRKVSFLTGKADRMKSHPSPRTKDRSISPDSSLSSPGFESLRSSYDHTGKSAKTHSVRALNSKGNAKSSRHKSPRQRPSMKAKTAAGRATAKEMDRFAETASDYFEKYYGRRKTSEGDTAEEEEDSVYYHSDGGVQYRDRGLDSSCQDADFEGFRTDLEAYKQELLKRSKQVRFDDILDDSAPGKMGGIRRKLANEEKRTRFRSEFLKDVYDQELVDYEEGMREQMSKLKTQGKDIGREYRKKVKSSPATTKYKPARKYTATKSVLLPKSKAHNRTTSGRRNRKRSATSSPAMGRHDVKFDDNEILPWLLEEFPFLHISSEALHDMWRKSAKQIEVLSKTDQYIKAKKNRAQQQIEEAEYKQKLLANIAKKELTHNDRMREIDERRKQQQSVKAALREKRLQHARVRKYYDDFHVRMRSKMLKKRTREEMVFKKLFEEGLKTQRDRIRDLRQYSRDQREERAQKQKDQLQSIENFYKDRFTLLGEALEKEREERLVTSKAQQKIVSSMNREFRKKTEKEIETIQEQIFRDEDDEYFRQLDADRLRQELHLARYKARV